MVMTSKLLADISDVLVDCDLFNSFAPQDIQLVAPYFNLQEMDEGDVVFNEGDRGTFMCIVGSGEVLVNKTNAEGELITLAKLKAGRTFGEMALLDGELRSASCIAKKDCVLLFLTQDSLNQMLAEVPRMAACVIRAVAVALSKRLRLADGRLVDL